MKKTIYLVLSLLLVAALAAGIAFSEWQFGAVSVTKTELSPARDDIFENYDIKKSGDTQTNKTKTYELYLYPSTLYLNDYINYLDGKSGSVLPEDKYGYIQPNVDENDNVTYTVVDKTSKGGDSQYLYDVSQNTTHTMENDTNITGMYYNVYKGNADWQGTVNDSALSSAPDITLGTVSGLPADTKFLYGDPVLDETVVEYSDDTTGITLQDTTGERHNWRNLHYYDRFGYWAYLSKGEGRYLPIKITVDENFSNTYFNLVSMNPLSDMGDPHDWFVYSFSCWAYVDHTGSKYSAPYFATDDFASTNSGTLYVNKDKSKNPSLASFCPTEVSKYFDIIESFDKYADSNGVIRLFPKFSNGKGYNAGSVKDGGGDAIKTVPTLKDANGDKAEMSPNDQHELYMFYTSETGTLTQNSETATVRVSILPNVDIDHYYQLDFKAALTSYTAGWPGGWTDVYTFGRDTAKGDNKNINDTLKAYGYGLYNLYLFITHVADSGSSTDFTSSLETMRQSIVNKSNSTDFPSLFGKNLLPIASAQAGNKSFMLVGEKVREAKFIGDVNFGSSGYTTEEEVQAKYLETHQSFRLINKDLYGCKKGDSTVSSTPINDQFPYCYILQNVDFTEATTQYCQIRFQRNYRSDLHFAEVSEYAYEFVEFSSAVYEQGFSNYFDIVTTPVYSKDGSSTNQQVIKLKNEEMRGVYDIILVFRSARESNPSSTVAYNIGLFAYRHTNIFLKVYDKEPTGKVYYKNVADGATISDTKTDYEFIDHSAEPLFLKSYPIGVSIKATDQNESATGHGATLASCVNTAVKNLNYDPTKIKLYDHVTGAEVAHYEKTPSVADNADNFYLLYGGDYYSLVFNPFKIRKNYIFFIKNSG